MGELWAIYSVICEHVESEKAGPARRTAEPALVRVADRIRTYNLPCRQQGALSIELQPHAWRKLCVWSDQKSFETSLCG